MIDSVRDKAEPPQSTRALHLNLTLNKISFGEWASRQIADYLVFSSISIAPT